MNTILTTLDGRVLRIVSLSTLALWLGLAAGCSQSKDQAAAHDEHAGHNHAETKSEGKTAAGPKICAEHNVPLEACGICKPQNLGALKPGDSLKVRLASAESATIAGVQVEKAAEAEVSAYVDCYAELSFNLNRYAQIAAPVSGLVQDVSVDLGTQVSENQTVAKLWSAGIAEALAKAMLSHQTLAREKRLRAERVTSEKDLQEAEATHRAACQQLSTLGFTEEQIDALVAKPQEPVLLELRAPFAGEIVERSAVRGALVESGKALFAVADRSLMWAMLNIPETALARVKPGQLVELRVESLPGRVFSGKLTWVAAEVDERTRMARARVEVENPDGALKSRMYAQARILTTSAEHALVVPTTAVHRVDGKALIFVKLEEDLFDVRAVKLGTALNGKVAVSEGILPKELVVVNHGFPLKSALLISRLGAGCADD